MGKILNLDSLIKKMKVSLSYYQKPIRNNSATCCKALITMKALMNYP